MTKRLLARYWKSVGVAWVIFLGIGLWLCWPQMAAATEYTFTLIAAQHQAENLLPTEPNPDPNATFDIAGVGPSINGNGEVAFRADTATSRKIYKGSGGLLTEIARSNPPHSVDQFPTINDQRPSTNDEATVAFLATAIHGPGPAALLGLGGIFTGRGIFPGSSGDLTRISPVGQWPAINNTGSVAFEQAGHIFVGNGGALIEPYVPGDVPEFGEFGGALGSVDLNDSGTVAFTGCGILACGIFAGPGRTLPPPAPPIPPPTPIRVHQPARLYGDPALSAPSINNSGMVAFIDRLQENVNSQAVETNTIFTGNGGPLTTIAQAVRGGPGPFSTPFLFFSTNRQGFVAINDTGMVVFWAAGHAFGQGIFTARKVENVIVVEKVKQTGDPLFDTTVDSFSFRRFGLNNAGQIAFEAILKGGRRVLVRADPVPEAAELIVIKHVINDHGEDETAADFTMTVSGSSPSPASFAGAEAPGTTVMLNAGSYSVTETGPSTYIASFSTDCVGSIGVGETKTCTVTNDDFRLGKTPGFWSNKDGNAILDAIADTNLDVPVTIGSGGPRSFMVSTIAQSNKILLNRACRSGAPVIFGSPCSLSSNLKSNTLEVLAAQTLALQYNINNDTFYTGQTIAGLSTATNTCTARLTSPLTSLGLSSASTVNDVLGQANTLIGNSAGGGTTTQAQASAMNSLLSCLNRETP